MKKALVIFNGIQFHYYHVDRAIEWATKNGGDLHGLFVHSDEEPPEGYIFPSDIDPAERLFNKKDAETANENVIHTQIKLFSDLVREKNIPLQSEELVDPPLKKILKMADEADIVFLDEAFDKSFLLACTRFGSKDLIKGSHCPVEVVHDNASL